jgi:CBS domain containing-hemolysin-like protein
VTLTDVLQAIAGDISVNGRRIRKNCKPCSEKMGFQAAGWDVADLPVQRDFQLVIENPPEKQQRQTLGGFVGYASVAFLHQPPFCMENFALLKLDMDGNRVIRCW